jgi:hypothetical protein
MKLKNIIAPEVPYILWLNIRTMWVLAETKLIDLRTWWLIRKIAKRDPQKASVLGEQLTRLRRMDWRQ